MLIYLLVMSLLLAPVDLLAGGPDFGDIVVLPLTEESLKLLLAIRYRQHLFSLIVIFALFELTLAKGPILVTASGDPDVWLLVLYSLLAFVFHVMTAVAYRTADTRKSLYWIFGACTAAHLIYNAQTIVIYDTTLSLCAALVTAGLPVLFATVITRIVGTSARGGAAESGVLP